MTAESSILPEAAKAPKLRRKIQNPKAHDATLIGQRKIHEHQHHRPCSHRHDRDRRSSVSRLAKKHAARRGSLLLADHQLWAGCDRMPDDLFHPWRSGGTDESRELDGYRIGDLSRGDRIRLPDRLSRWVPHQPDVARM